MSPLNEAATSPKGGSKHDVNGGREGVVHIIDTLAAGGAQHILIAITKDNDQAVVCTLHSREDGTDLAGHFSEVDALARSKYSVPKILLSLTGRVLRFRHRFFFNAHLDASTLFLCVLRKFISFRLVVTVHCTQAQWPAWFREVFRRVIFSADHVILESHRAFEEMLAIGLPTERLTLIPIGTMFTGPIGTSSASDVRIEFDIPADVPIFLNIARMVPGKGQINLIRAMTNVPGAVAIIVGYGPEEKRLRAEVAKLGLDSQVRFAGLRLDLAGFYAAARAFVMPCIDESMGVVVYNALTCKIPVVAYATGSIGEIVEDGKNGYLVPPDTTALAGALRRILNDQTVFRFSDPAVYSSETMVMRHHALYRELNSKWFGCARQ